MGTSAIDSNLVLPTIATDLNLTGQAAEDFPVFDGTNWLAQGATELLKVGNFTRDSSLASGTQVITGLGFKPKGVLFFGCKTLTSVMALGIIDSAQIRKSIADDHAINADSWRIDVGNVLQFIESSPNQYIATNAVFTADGFDISWTRNATPTGTLSIHYMAFR